MQETKRRDFLNAGVGAAVAMGSPRPLTIYRGSTPECTQEISAQVAAVQVAQDIGITGLSQTIPISLKER